MLILDRRAFLTLSAAGALFLTPAAAFAQRAADVDPAELHAPGQLGEKALGQADAPVTVVEYASMSCPHCATFDAQTFDAFKQKYIDTGQVRFIFREFPLNAPAYAVAMIARCAPADRFFDLVHAYFRSQNEWLRAQNLRAAILDKAKGFGFTEQSFDACISNQSLFASLEAVKQRGLGFGVQATPTFFVNGRKLEGALSVEELDQAIQPFL